MKKRQRVWAVLLIVSMLMMFIPSGGVAGVQAGSSSTLGITPEYLSDPDNADPCGEGWNTIKIESKDFTLGQSQQYSDGVLDISYTVTDGIYLEWSANVPVNVVIIKGGSVGNLYDYGSASATGDSGLHAPLNINSGNYYDISYIAFCYYIPPKQLVPILECVADNGDGTYTAYWGYANLSYEILDAYESYFTGNTLGGTTQPPDQGFLPGVQKNVFTTVFDGEDLSWTLAGPDEVTTVITANLTSAQCPGDEPLRPVLECVEPLGDGLYRAWWGYKNDNHYVVNALESKFTGNATGETTTPPLTGFLPGRHTKVFSTIFDGNNLVWTLKGENGQTRTATASENSKACEPGMLPLTLTSLCTGTDSLVIIDWIITNPNDFHVLVTWSVEGQTGMHTAPPGISSFSTTKVPGSPNSMTLSYEDNVIAVVPRACYQTLVLEALCSEDPETTLKWKITNPNGYAVDADWKILLAQPAQTGTLTVPGKGEVIFYTDTIPNDPNIAMIFVDDVVQLDGIAANFTTCPPIIVDDPFVPEQEIISLPDLGVPSLPGTEIIRVDVEAFELDLLPELPAIGGEEITEELPATSGNPLTVLPSAILLAAGLLLRKKKY